MVPEKTYPLIVTLGGTLDTARSARPAVRTRESRDVSVYSERASLDDASSLENTNTNAAPDPAFMRARRSPAIVVPKPDGSVAMRPEGGQGNSPRSGLGGGGLQVAVALC